MLERYSQAILCDNVRSNHAQQDRVTQNCSQSVAPMLAAPPNAPRGPPPSHVRRFSVRGDEGSGGNELPSVEGVNAVRPPTAPSNHQSPRLPSPKQRRFSHSSSSGSSVPSSARTSGGPLSTRKSPGGTPRRASVMVTTSRGRGKTPRTTRIGDRLIEQHTLHVESTPPTPSFPIQLKEELEKKIKDSEEVITSLRQEAEKLRAEVERLRDLVERHVKEKEAVKTHAERERRVLHSQLEESKATVKQQKKEIKRLLPLIEQNAELRARIAEQDAEIADQRTKIVALTEEHQRNKREFGLALRREFRKALSFLKQDLRDEILQHMDKETRMAVEENAYLNNRLVLQNRNLEMYLHEYAALAQSYRQLKIEREIERALVASQTAKASQLLKDPKFAELATGGSPAVTTSTTTTTTSRSSSNAASPSPSSTSVHTSASEHVAANTSPIHSILSAATAVVSTPSGDANNVEANGHAAANSIALHARNCMPYI